MGYGSAVDQKYHVVVINWQTGKWLTTIPLTGGPYYQIRSNPNGKYVYMLACCNGSYSYAAIDVISTSTNKVVTSISTSTSENDMPLNMAVSPDGTYILASDSRTGVLHLICAVRNVHLRDITIPGEQIVGPLVFSTDGKFVFAYAHSGLVKIATANWTAVGCVPGVVTPFLVISRMVLSPDGKRLYAPTGNALYAPYTGDGVAEINPDTMQMISFTERPDACVSLSLTPDGKNLYVLEYQQDGPNSSRSWRYEILDTVTLNTVNSFPYSPESAPLAPSDVGFTPDGKSAYLNITHGIVTYSLPDLKQTGTFRFDGAQRGIAFLPWK